MEQETINYATHDSEIERLMFEVSPSNPSVKKFIYRQLYQKAYLSIVRFVARHLIKFREPEQVKVLLNKYTVVIVYNYLNDSDYLPEGLKCQHLEDCLKDGITIEKLEEQYESDNLFMKLFNDNYKTYNSTKKQIEEVLKVNNTAKKLKVIHSILFNLYNYFNYFQMTTNFTEYKDSRRSYDFIVAEALTYDKEREFDFEILDKESFLENVMQYQIDDNGNKLEESETFTTKVLPRRNKDAEIIVGHLINDILANNVDIHKVKTIDSKELKCYTLNTSSSFASKGLDRKTFIYFLDYINDGYYLNLDKVKEFKFKYNNENYVLNTLGISKL